MDGAMHATNFQADGPVPDGSLNVGFIASADAYFQIGVQGIGSLSPKPVEIYEPIGVQGMSAWSDGTLLPGVGVEGVSAGGPGVRGRTGGEGIGVQGLSETGTGVSGTSDSIGVQGEGGSIGVLGGVLPAALTAQPNYAAVAGNGPTDSSVFAFSYGGWFSRGAGVPGATAPLHLEPAGPENPNPPLAAQMGDLFVDAPDANDVRLYFCTQTGDNNPTPATWKQVQLL